MRDREGNRDGRCERARKIWRERERERDRWRSRASHGRERNITLLSTSRGDPIAPFSRHGARREPRFAVADRLADLNEAGTSASAVVLVT